MEPPAIMEPEYKSSDFVDVMRDPRVQRALGYVLRDRSICREFDHLRDEVGAHEAIHVLSERYCLSDEAIRTIVYRKRDVD